ncbi:MAG: xylulokinase [Planctomycetota bacterium]|jgi:xylulokinase|nr:xylulokinase [Planctomycetota bacterium]
MERLILAHDLGTSGIKASLFCENGELLESAAHSYPSEFSPGGRAEQDPEDWWRAACAATRELCGRHGADRVSAIAASGMMMGCLCVDGNGVPLRKHILYCDQRSTAQAERFTERAGEWEIYKISGNRPSASYCAAKYMWVKENQPDIYRNTHKLVNAKDYLNFRLTGKIATDPTDASGTNLYDLLSGSWSGKMLDAAGLDGELLPEIAPSTAVLGELTRAAAEALGLRPGIPVMTGAADGVCASVGVGCVKPGAIYNYIGSSSWIAAAADEPVYDPKMRTITFAHAAPGVFNPMGIMQVAGGAYSWLRDEICRAESLEAEEKGRNVYELLDALAAESPPGANGVLFLPYLLGERTPHWDPLARAAFVGMGMANGRADLVRSVLEGVAYNLSITVDIFREMGGELKEMPVIGGGAKGGLWRQILADVYDLDVLLPNYLEEATSIGAAIVAGVGAGIFPDLSAADRFIKIVDRLAPIVENQPTYRRRKENFLAVYEALKPVFPKLVCESPL